MKKVKTVSVVLAVLLMASMLLLGGCSGSAQPSASSSAPASSSPTPAESTPATSESVAPSASASASASASGTFSAASLPHDPNSEVYNYLSDIGFGGVSKPVMDSRASINKALPVQKKDKIVVGWSSPTQGSSYFTGNKLGAQEQCDKYGYTLKFLASDNFDATKESANIEALVSQKVDVLVVDPADTTANLIDVKRAVDAGIPVVACGVAFKSDAPVITTITNNNYYVGFATGQYAAKFYKDKITAVDIPGQRGHPVSESEDNGFIAGWVWGKMEMAGTAKVVEDAMLEGYNFYKQLRDNGKVDMGKYNLVIAGSVNGGFVETTGMSAAEDLLTANPDTSMIWTSNDHMGMGAYKVLEQRNLTDKVKIFCASDADAVALEYVRDGKLQCTGYNSGVMIGKNAIELIHKIFAEGYDANNMPIISGLPITVITKDNVDSFIVAGSEYPSEQWIDFKTIDELTK